MPPPQPARRIYQFGPFSLNPGARLLLREGQVVPLNPKVFETLVVLVENAGRPVEKNALLRAIWPDTFVEEENLAHNVSVLRKTLGEGPGGRPYIETLRKLGYQFVGRVSVGWEECLAGDSAIVPGPQLVALPHPSVRRWPRAATAAVVLAGAIVAALAGYLLLSRAEDRSLKTGTFTQLTDQPGQELFPSLGPDGQSFVYASRAAGNWDIYFQRVGGRNAMNLTQDSPADDTQPAFSPHGDQIAFRSERDGGGIFVMGATGESVRRLADFGHHPAWSPDGGEIVCATASFLRPDSRWQPHSQLFSINVSTGEKRLLTAGIEDAVQPSWSPNGLRIAYWSLTRGQRDIWSLPARGGEAVPLTNDVYVDWNPVWSPDGKFLYFSSDRGGSMNLWRIRIDEESGRGLGQPEPLTTPSPYAGPFSLSRDGRRILYAHQVGTSNIHAVGFDPFAERIVGPPVPITQGLREAVRPDLSPDGRWLAFNTWGREDVFVARTDGTGLRQLTRDVHKDRGARWAPDGKRIAFQSNRSGQWEIWTISPEGNELRQFSQTRSQNIFQPVWSPDGSRLAASVDGGARTFIAEMGRPWSEGSVEILPASALGGAFVASSWSRDGRKLAGFRLTTDGLFSGIVIYSLASGEYRLLTESGYAPRWLSDSRRLLFNHQGKICLADTGSARVREILSAAPHQVESYFVISPDDRRIYFSQTVVEADIWLLNLAR